MPAEACSGSSAWDRFARFYDWQLPLERRALVAALDLVSIDADDRVLDLATGTGALLRLLAARTGGPRRAVGIDTSSRMLARAADLPPGWQLLRGDATGLPFADGSFDIVSVAYLLHLLDSAARHTVIQEIRRLLSPGGRLLSVTVVAPRTGLLAPAWTAIAAGAQRRSGIMAGLRPLDPRLELLEAGFALLRARLSTRGYPSLVTLAERKR